MIDICIYVFYSFSITAPSAGPTPFVFSSAPSAGFGNNQTPSFGSSFGSPFPATPSQTPAFGAKPNPPLAFGQQSNPTPVFGQGANPAPGEWLAFEPHDFSCDIKM